MFLNFLSFNLEPADKAENNPHKFSETCLLTPKLRRPLLKWKGKFSQQTNKRTSQYGGEVQVIEAKVAVD